MSLSLCGETMPGLGAGNPFPFELGGGPSQVEEVYDTLYQSVGTALQAEEGTIVSAWRWAKSYGIAATSQDERAFYQAFPDQSTDYLPVWEDILEIVPPSDATVVERQAAVLEAYTRSIDATYPKLDATLTSIDSRMEILIVPTANTRTTVPPRGFQDWDPSAGDACGPPFNLVFGADSGSTCTGVPNVSSDFVLYLFYDTGGAMTVSDARKLEDAKASLNESLPAWVDFRSFTDCGFILDEDLLDITAFCDGIVSP